MSVSNLHTHWSKLFLRSLVQSGIEHIVISPGSRSTPLTLAAATEPGVTCHVLADERVAAFFALGQARLAGKPSALLCTSGTAVAHYLPAIIEASLCGIPMLVITADRPWELYDTAASQTIDQTKIFGSYVRHFAELGVPDSTIEALRAVPRIAAQAVASSLGPTPGPVHINARFRKPLEPVDADAEPWAKELSRLLSTGAPAVYHAAQEPSSQALTALTHALSVAQRPLFVCGPMLGAGAQEKTREMIVALAERLGAPLCAEATSSLRFGAQIPGVSICGSLDSLLRDARFRQSISPDVIIELGMPPISSSYASWLTERPEINRFVVAPFGWNDPIQTARALIFASPSKLAERLLEKIPLYPERFSAWRSFFEKAEGLVWSCVDKATENFFSEGSLAKCLVENLPERSVLVLGNSNPVRDIDTYCAPTTKPITVLHQRGASGIDGLVSGAAGARSISRQPVVLFLGDVSLIHDLGGLNAVQSVSGPLVIVVVQNNGGRIFEQLPLGKRQELSSLVETYFVTPQKAELASAASLFGLVHHRVEDTISFKAALSEALAGNQKVLIEAIVSGEGHRDRTTLWAEIGASLRGAL